MLGVQNLCAIHILLRSISTASITLHYITEINKRFSTKVKRFLFEVILAVVIVHIEMCKTQRFCTPSTFHYRYTTAHLTLSLSHFLKQYSTGFSNSGGLSSR